MNRTAVILIHGFNVTDWRRTIGKFRPAFERLGCLVENYTYGYLPWPYQAAVRNPAFAGEVAERCKYWKERGYLVYVACHSNGAVITRLAAELHNAPIDKVLAVHPALRKDLDPCKTAKKIAVVHNQGDIAVVAGGILGRISRWIFPKSWNTRPWGQMGQDGYVGGFDRRITNVDTGETPPFSPKADGHSDEFSAKKAGYFTEVLAKLLINL